MNERPLALAALQHAVVHQLLQGAVRGDEGDGQLL